MMGPDRRADLPADGPGSIVPQQPQDALPLAGEPLAEPGENGCRHVAHGPAVDTPALTSVHIGPQQPLAGQGFGVCIPAGEHRCHETEGLARGPAGQRRLG
jgi:hypothetical protein